MELTQEVVTCIRIDFGLGVTVTKSNHFETQIGRIVLNTGMVGDIVEKLFAVLNGAFHKTVHVLNRNTRFLTHILQLSENVNLHCADIINSSIMDII